MPENGIKLAHYVPEKEWLFSEGSIESNLSERGAWPLPSLPTTSIWKRRETERVGSCHSLITSTESARKIVKAYPSVEGAGGAHGHLHSLFAICFSLFVFSCRVSNFHFSFPRRMRTDCPIEASKWCFGFCHQREPSSDASVLRSMQSEAVGEHLFTPLAHHVSHLPIQTVFKLHPSLTNHWSPSQQTWS